MIQIQIQIESLHTRLDEIDEMTSVSVSVSVSVCWAPSKGYNPHGRSRDDAWGFFGFRFCAFVCHSAAFC